MASVSSYDEKRWRLSFFDKSKSPKRKATYLKKKSYYKTYGYTKKQAETEAFRLEQLHKQGEIDLWTSDTDSKSLTVKEALSEWQKKAKRTLAKDTINTTSSRINNFIKEFGNVYLDNVSTKALNEHINEPDNLNSRSIRKYAIKCIFPDRDLKVISSRRERNELKQITSEQWISEKELHLLCDELLKMNKESNQIKRGKDLMPFIHLVKLAFYTGLRRSDLLNMKPDWINKDELTIGGEYRPKSQRKSETIALLPKAIEVLNETELPFDFSRDYVTATFKKAARRTFGKDTQIHFHSLRHSFVKYCLDDLGLPERITKQLTRHKNQVTFERYTHDDVDHVKEYIKKRV